MNFFVIIVRLMKKPTFLARLILLLPLCFGCRQSGNLPEDALVPVQDIRLSPLSLTLEQGASERLSVQVIPENATDPSVQWSSDKETVATVLEGMVTAVGPGSAQIKVIANDGGFRAVCLVTVPEPEPEPEPEPDPDPRWTDTGAGVPVWPDYKPVGNVNDFPAIHITTDDGQRVESKTEYKTGTIRFTDPAGMYSDVQELPAAKMKIRGRGNSTWDSYKWTKPPYRIKLDKKSKVFGMKSDKDWILLSDHGDPTLLRTAVALQISRLVSMPWTPQYRMAEVYFNGNYQGVYYLVEHKEADRENKIPITPMEGDQTEGGFLVELDGKEDEDLFFRSEYFNKKIKFKDPDEPTGAQREFIQGCLNQVEKKLMDRAFKGEGNYREYIVLDTWIRNYLVHEVTMNIDGNMRLSTYFAKDGDTRVFMPMVWDFDRAFGGADYMQSVFKVPEVWPYGWFVRIRGGDEGFDGVYRDGFRPTWYQYMFEDPVFVARLKQLWTLYKPRLDRIPEFIDKMRSYNEPACHHNDAFFQRGGRDAAIDRLRSDYIKRLTWLDQQIPVLRPRRYDPATGQYE